MESEIKDSRRDAEAQSIGNAAKMREAVKSLMDNLQIHAMMPCEQITMNRAEVCAMIEDCRAALAAPARNCDRFNSGDPVKDADDAYAEWQRQCDAVGVPPSCKVESAFRQWLFATAKPETKGETDGCK